MINDALKKPIQFCVNIMVEKNIAFLSFVMFCFMIVVFC